LSEQPKKIQLDTQSAGTPNSVILFPPSIAGLLNKAPGKEKPSHIQRWI